MPTVEGTDRVWFLEDPPPLSNRRKPSTDALARYREFEQRKIYGPQAQYIWNREFVKARICSVFANYPAEIACFDPPDGTQFPRYRFLPSATHASGLVSNRFGLRGPEIDLQKPARTIRIAFVGASTTVHVHSNPYSYPERVGYWLNRYALAHGLNVKFEALNAGREGLGSYDIAAIVRQELLPLDPDLVVYYEGANQFTPGALAVDVERSKSQAPDVADWFREHTAVGDLLARAGMIPSPTGEPGKPPHKLVWPPAVNLRSPDPDNPANPLDLPTIVGDLDNIREALRPTGARLTLSSFVWLAGERLRISPTTHPHIWKHLNGTLAPLTYGEVRRIADFQNEIYRRYAETRGIEFLDIARLMPQDPSLFSDAVHLLDSGERLKAWIVFQQLVPLIRSDIAAGRLPRSSPAGSLPPPPSLEWRTMELRCKDTAPPK